MHDARLQSPTCWAQHGAHGTAHTIGACRTHVRACRGRQCSGDTIAPRVAGHGARGAAGAIGPLRAVGGAGAGSGDRSAVLPWCTVGADTRTRGAVPAPRALHVCGRGGSWRAGKPVGLQWRRGHCCYRWTASVLIISVHRDGCVLISVEEVECAHFFASDNVRLGHGCTWIAHRPPSLLACA
jgi:hypothetical protein